MELDIKITDQDLPVLSIVATQAIDLLKNPDVTYRQLDELIRQDPSLTQRLLHIANSPFYAGRKQAQTIGETLVRLGMRQIRSVLIAAATGELFSSDDPHIQAFWDHATATAIASQILADELQVPGAEEAYVAGILHDVGKVIIYNQFPEIYAETIEAARAAGRPLIDVENERFRFFTHTSIGGLVVRKWRLSDSVAEAARFHHDLLHNAVRAVMNMALASCVSLGCVLVNQSGIGNQAGQPVETESLFCAQFLRLAGDRLARLAAKINEAIAAQRPAAA